MTVRFLPCGDCALVVEFGCTIERALSDQVLRLDSAVRDSGLRGLVASVPTFRSLMVHYDPLLTSSATLSEEIRGLLAARDESPAAGRRWFLPACYEPDCAPDLGSVAERTGLSPAQVVELHSARSYHVYMIGFVAGFPYMGDLPQQLELPRREEPRLRVPPGSVAIATSMTAIYPVESPGGWHLIGSTPVRIFDISEDQPARFAPGDQIVFQPVSQAERDRIASAVAADDYEMIWEDIAA